jgi:shikimate dehydrogenase
MVPVDPADLRAGQVLFDTIYSPRKTPLLTAAEARGAVPIGGLAMLVHQARHQLEGWLGEPVAASVLWSAVEGI